MTEKKSARFEEFFQDDPKEWIDSLPDFQKDSINELLNKGKSYEDVAIHWLSASAQNTRPFGTTDQRIKGDSFLNHLKDEVEKYICGDPKYESERSKLFGENGIGKAYAISCLSIAISQKLSVAAMFISPLISLVLASIGKITINSWCASQKEQKIMIEEKKP